MPIGFRLQLPVFSDSDLSVEVKENSLVVSAKKATEETERTYLHRGYRDPRI